MLIRKYSLVRKTEQMFRQTLSVMTLSHVGFRMNDYLTLPGVFSVLRVIRGSAAFFETQVERSLMVEMTSAHGAKMAASTNH